MSCAIRNLFPTDKICVIIWDPSVVNFKNRFALTPLETLDSFHQLLVF